MTAPLRFAGALESTTADKEEENVTTITTTWLMFSESEIEILDLNRDPHTSDDSGGFGRSGGGVIGFVGHVEVKRNEVAATESGGFDRGHRT